MARILLIEDDDAIRLVLRTRLLDRGHTVDEANNGRPGLERFRQDPPELVITDLVMPYMDGMETIRLMKLEAPTVKIIAMTGGGTIPAGTYLRIAQTMGASYVLAKPFSLQELDVAVDTVLRPDAEIPAAVTDTRFTILVIDDDEKTRHLNRCAIEDVLPQSTVVECASVEQALVVTSNNAIDAVITDHHLGQSDGANFVIKLRQQGNHCPVAMVTNSSDPLVHRRAYDAGAWRVFSGSEKNFAPSLRAHLLAQRGR